MAGDRRVPLRAQDATSWEEFQARYDAEVERAIRREKSLLRQLWTTALAIASVLIDAILWAAFATTSSPGRWIVLVLAVLFIAVVIFSLALLPARGRPVTAVQRELDAVRPEWKARAERGEIPMTTPGGPKIWQDQ